MTSLPCIEFRNEITVELVRSSGNDMAILNAARVSVGDDYVETAPEKELSGLINYLMKHRHGTPFEHASMTFYVHAPIFVFREWHRHRIGWSYNEESARYHQLKPVFWLPREDRPLVPEPGFKSARPKFQAASLEEVAAFHRQLEYIYSLSYQSYDGLIQSGYAREAARAVLPVGIYSSMYATCNPRSLMAFLSLRVHDKDATFVSYPQLEIQNAAQKMEEFFKVRFPVTAAAFVKNGRVAP